MTSCLYQCIRHIYNLTHLVYITLCTNSCVFWGFYRSKYTCQLIQSNRCSSQCSVAIQAENRKIAKYMCTGFFLYNFVPIAFKMMGTFCTRYVPQSHHRPGERIVLHTVTLRLLPTLFMQRLAVEIQSGNSASILGIITSLLVDDYSSFFFFVCFVVSMLLLSVPSVCFIYCFILHLQKKTFEKQNKQNCINCNTQTW